MDFNFLAVFLNLKIEFRFFNNSVKFFYSVNFKIMKFALLAFKNIFENFFDQSFINVFFITVVESLHIKGKHSYSHHAQLGLTFHSNLITLIDKYYDRVRLG